MAESFFFFQAEDGIRDIGVTGVQTCALPISTFSALDPEERCARRELGRLLAKTIAQLPPDLRQACLLRDVLHYSTQEVAGRLGISVVAVRLRLFRAHRRLREKLQDSLAPTARQYRPRVRPEYQQPTRRFAPLATPEYASGD